MINANATPDLDMTAVINTAAKNAAIQNTINSEIAAKDPWHKRLATKTFELGKKALEKIKAAGKSLGSFVYVMTFDEELWYSKLNNDVIKLNIYLTTTIGEFNLVLNVLQMGYITKGFNGDKGAINALTVKQKHITQSSEYMRMLIGILLNDILKLRVNVSYCTRGTAGLTKGELVCLGYQDTDGAGNIVTTYRRQLHSMIITISEKLHDTTSVYSQVDGLKGKVMDSVVKPYIEILEKLKRNKESSKDEDMYITVPDEIQNALKESVSDSIAFYKLKVGFDKMLSELNIKIKDNLASNIDKFNTKISDEIVKISNSPVQRGGWPWSKTNDPAAAEKAAAEKAAAAAAAKAKAAEDAAQRHMRNDSFSEKDKDAYQRAADAKAKTAADAAAAAAAAAAADAAAGPTTLPAAAAAAEVPKPGFFGSLFKKNNTVAPSTEPAVVAPSSSPAADAPAPDPGAKTDADGKRKLPPTAPERTGELVDGVTEYITTEPYVTIPDKVLSEFLTAVYMFSKKEGKTTEAETKDVLDKAIKIAEQAQNETAVADIGKQLNDKNDATKIAATVLSDASAGASAGAAIDNVPGDKGGKDGGRRLTRKRGLKKRAKFRTTRIKRKMYQHSKIKVKALPKVGIINNKFGNYMVSMPAGRMK
jgi:hypothetical protein